MFGILDSAAMAPNENPLSEIQVASAINNPVLMMVTH